MPARIVFAQTDEMAIALIGLVAYSTGFGGDLSLRFHHESAGIDLRSASPLMVRFGNHNVTDETLRFGIEFADGRRATNLDAFPAHGGVDPPIALMPGGGGGGSNSYRVGFWVYPLPPAGSVTFAFEWPSRGVGLTKYTIEASEIVDAASRSLTLWEDGRPVSAGPGSGSGGFSSHQSVMSARAKRPSPPADG